MLNYYRYHLGQFEITMSEVKFTGDDVFDFLQNQSTYDIAQIKSNSFQLISFLDPQGRVESYGWLTKTDKAYSYLIPSSLLEKSLVRLNKFLISEDVTISDPETKEFTVLIGPEVENQKIPNSYAGVLFDEETLLLDSKQEVTKKLTNNEIETWRGLTGYPSFDGSDYSYEIINNLRLFDLTVVMNKGCYPGQETVSKIATRRGAAYSPVLIETNESLSGGDVVTFERKIGTAQKSYNWEGKHYLSAALLRDFRVEGMKLHFILNGKEHDGVVRYYPLIPGNKKDKAKELFYEASDSFRHDDLKTSEEKFRLAIKLDPTFADAYESLGVMLGRQERFQEAIDLMEELSKVDPKSVLAHTNMSLYLMRLGKITEAEEQKSMATVKSFQKFGDEAQEKRQNDEAKKRQMEEWAQRESMFLQVLEIDEEDTLANYGVGSIAVEKGEWERARNHLEKVLKADPKYSVAYLALGKALKGLNRIQEAKDVWREGIKVAAAKGDLMPANQMQFELDRA